ncbi:MAG: hypothetical protein SFV19_06605 [Rhodospirillaceae bacterium]|nr:hypothetical protein [Rhodospirillaceae bacterium]
MSTNTADDRAMRATEALNNAALREAFTLLKDNYLAALRRCDAKDDLGRYRYAVALNTVDAVERHLRAAVESGALDEAQANEFAERPKRWIPRF